MTINNLPTYARRYPFIVARFVDGQFWFWGAFSDRRQANEAALEEGGVTFEADLVDWGE